MAAVPCLAGDDDHPVAAAMVRLAVQRAEDRLHGEPRGGEEAAHLRRRVEALGRAALLFRDPGDRPLHCDALCPRVPPGEHAHAVLEVHGPEVAQDPLAVQLVHQEPPPRAQGPGEAPRHVGVLGIGEVSEAVEPVAHGVELVLEIDGAQVHAPEIGLHSLLPEPPPGAAYEGPPQVDADDLHPVPGQGKGDPSGAAGSIKETLPPADLQHAAEGPGLRLPALVRAEPQVIVEALEPVLSWRRLPAGGRSHG